MPCMCQLLGMHMPKYLVSLLIKVATDMKTIVHKSTDKKSHYACFTCEEQYLPWSKKSWSDNYLRLHGEVDDEML